MPLHPSIVLVSGGLDSAVAAACAAKTTRPAFLHVNYGQKTEARELESFNSLAEHFKVEKKLVVDIGHLRAIGGSALIDENIEVPTMGAASPPDGAGAGAAASPPATYVPFRNANLLSIAVSWAEVLLEGSQITGMPIYIGAVEEDAPGYPDCRRDFFEAFERAAGLGTRPETGIRIETPLIDMTRPDIVRLGVELRVPFGLTWSCYVSTDLACGECDSCVLRIRGFKGAGVEDPIAYKTRPVEL
jgi:7-cyano-7-deazaguanine synthase